MSTGAIIETEVIIEKIDLDKVNWRGSREFFESLGEALDKLDDKDESYDFTWVGKRKAIIEAGAPINKTFRPDVEASKNWDTTENLFIEGDNLDALKLLQESYLGKVKMIYIDPPYNTGKDFVYHDDFKATPKDYDADTEYKDDEDNIQFKKNEKTNGRYHSDWLSMMYPRLKLARNLLADNGVIFISIDDNEQTNLKKLCDEILGEDNLIAQIIIQANKGGQDYRELAKTHEYILCYSRSEESTLNEIDQPDFKFSYTDSEGGYNKRELRNRNPKFGSFNRPNLFYPFYVDPTEDNDGFCATSLEHTKKYSVEVLPFNSLGKESCWRWGRDKVKRNIDGTTSGSQVIAMQKKDGGWNIYEKHRKTTTKAKTIWDESDVRTEQGTIDVRELRLGGYFDHPKSVALMKKVINLGSTDDSVILDFFSGSGTTAHAVMQLNAEDGGNRKHIQVQLPENTDEKSEAYTAGYRTIPDIARERIRRAGEKITAEHPNAKVDYGFRALTIADTNYKEVYKSAGEYQQPSLLDAVDNVKEDRSDLDLLYGILTQSALELNRPIKALEVTGVATYQYDYFSEVSGLVACFAKNVPEETIKAIAALKPLTAVFRDSSFSDSQAKVNLSEHFRILSPDTKVKVI